MQRRGQPDGQCRKRSSMKKMIPILLLLALSAVFSACSKEKENIPAPRAPFIGTWREASHFISTGSSAVIWTSTTPDRSEVITFGNDSGFNSSDYPDLDHCLVDWEIADTGFATLRVYGQGRSDTTYWWLRRVANDTIQVNYPCIEGCGKKFVPAGGE